MVEVLFTDEFETWWNGLSMEEQVRINATIMFLEAHGVDLGSPHSSKVLGSRYSHMRELAYSMKGVRTGFCMHSIPAGMPCFCSAATRPETTAGMKSSCRLRTAHTQST